MYLVLKERCYQLTSDDGTKVDAYPHENLFSSQEEADTQIVLHCLEVDRSEREDTTIVVPNSVNSIWERN